MTATTTAALFGGLDEETVERAASLSVTGLYGAPRVPEFGPAARLALLAAAPDGAGPDWLSTPAAADAAHAAAQGFYDRPPRLFGLAVTDDLSRKARAAGA